MASGKGRRTTQAAAGSHVLTRTAVKVLDGGSLIRLLMPWPPSSNNLYFVRNNRKVLSEEGRLYHAEVLGAVLEAGSPRLLANCRLEAILDVYPPDRRRRDLANFEKVATDSAKLAGVIEDDCLIDRWVITRRDVVAGGLIVLSLSVKRD